MRKYTIITLPEGGLGIRGGGTEIIAREGWNITHEGWHIAPGGGKFAPPWPC